MLTHGVTISKAAASHVTQAGHGARPRTRNHAANRLPSGAATMAYRRKPVGAAVGIQSASATGIAQATAIRRRSGGGRTFHRHATNATAASATTAGTTYSFMLNKLNWKRSVQSPTGAESLPHSS